MSRGLPSMTARLGLLAIAGYQTGTRSLRCSVEKRGKPIRTRETLHGPSGLGGLLGGLGGAGAGGILSGGLGELIDGSSRAAEARLRIPG